MKKEELTRSQQEGLIKFMVSMQTSIDVLVTHFNLPFKLLITVKDKDDKFFTPEIFEGTYGLGLSKELKDLLKTTKDQGTV